MSISRINAWFVVYAVTVVFITVSLWFIVRDNTLNGGTTTAKTSVFLSGPGELNDKGECFFFLTINNRAIIISFGYPRCQS